MKTNTARFPSWCNVIDDNVILLDENYIIKTNTH